MEFSEFLRNRHSIIHGAKKLKEVSVQQYNNRLTNMVAQKIYNEEEQLDETIVNKINAKYSNRANEYERTINYYIEYKNHLKKRLV